MFSKLVRWTPESAAKWEQTRQRGRRRYVWQVGVVSWGIPMFLVMTPLLYVQQHGLTWPAVGGIHLLSLILGIAVINAVIFLLGGYCFGAIMWSTMEKAYRRYQEESVGG